MNRLLVVATSLLLSPVGSGALHAEEDSVGQIHADAEALRAGEGYSGDSRRLSELIDRCMAVAASQRGKDEAFEACALALRIATGVDEDKKIATVREATGALRSSFSNSPRIGEVVLGPLRRLYEDLEPEVGDQINALERSTTSDSVRCACTFVRIAQELGESPTLKERKSAAAKYGELITKYGAVELPGSKSRRWKEFLQLEIEGLTTYAVGGTPPDVVGVDLDGQPLKLSEHRGKVVLLDFWAFWSPTSVELLAHERELTEKLKAEPFAVVGVNHDDDLATDRAQELADAKLPWRSFQKSNEPSIAEKWRVRAWPTIFLLDAQGKIRKKWLGAPDYREIDQEIAELLAEITGKSNKPAKPGAPPPTAPPPKKD